MFTKFWRIAAIYLALGSPLALAQDSIFGPSAAPPYMAPSRLFSVVLPPGWEPRTFPDKPDLVEIRVPHAGNTFLQIQRRPISPGAKARQLLARALESRLTKLPHFREVQRRDVNFNSLKGAAVVGTFWYQGNAQYPRAVEEIYLVLGNESFELHFECFEPLTGQISGDLNRVYGSFVPRPPSPSTTPVPDDEEDPLDKIPF